MTSPFHRGTQQRHAVLVSRVRPNLSSRCYVAGSPEDGHKCKSRRAFLQHQTNLSFWRRRSNPLDHSLQGSKSPSSNRETCWWRRRSSQEGGSCSARNERFCFLGSGRWRRPRTLLCSWGRRERWRHSQRPCFGASMQSLRHFPRFPFARSLPDPAVAVCARVFLVAILLRRRSRCQRTLRIPARGARPRLRGTHLAQVAPIQRP